MATKSSQTIGGVPITDTQFSVRKGLVVIGGSQVEVNCMTPVRDSEFSAYDGNYRPMTVFIYDVNLAKSYDGVVHKPTDSMMVHTFMHLMVAESDFLPNLEDDKKQPLKITMDQTCIDFGRPSGLYKVVKKSYSETAPDAHGTQQSMNQLFLYILCARRYATLKDIKMKDSTTAQSKKMMGLFTQDGLTTKSFNEITTQFERFSHMTDQVNGYMLISAALDFWLRTFSHFEKIKSLSYIRWGTLWTNGFGMSLMEHLTQMVIDRQGDYLSLLILCVSPATSRDAAVFLKASGAAGESPFLFYQRSLQQVNASQFSSQACPALFMFVTALGCIENNNRYLETRLLEGSTDDPIRMACLVHLLENSSSDEFSRKVYTMGETTDLDEASFRSDRKKAKILAKLGRTQFSLSSLVKMCSPSTSNKEGTMGHALLSLTKSQGDIRKDLDDLRLQIADATASIDKSGLDIDEDNKKGKSKTVLASFTA